MNAAKIAPARCPVCHGRGMVLVESGPHSKTYADCGEVSCSSRKERLAHHDPKSCTHKHCQPTPF